MKRLLRLLRSARFSNTPLIHVLVHRERLLHNLHVFQRAYLGLGIAPVLKSNAYGHGLPEVGDILKNERVPFLCVDSYYEARVLRSAGVRLPILVIGHTLPALMREGRARDVAFAVISLEELRRLVSMRLPRPLRVHLKFDTGMHRQGLMPDELDEAAAIVAMTKGKIIVEGIFSHLADADRPGSTLTPKQIAAWNDLAARAKKLFPQLRWLHLAATKGSVYSKDIDANVMRLGIGLYGMSPGPLVDGSDLRPAMEVRSLISSVRTVPAGETVGYNATFTAPRDLRIATVPFGYYEGLDRRLSGNAELLVKNTPCPVIGRISMNMCSIDVSAVPGGARLGDEVTIISADPAAPNCAQALAARFGTIPYEVVARIPPHLKRLVV